MLEPVKAAFGQFVGRYFASLVPTTRPLERYVQRELDDAIKWAPARMVDQVEEMLSQWFRADHGPGPTKPPELPAILVAMAKDYTPTGRDYTRQVADRMLVMILGDPKERLFGLRAVAGDIRAQLVFVATDEPSARSLAAQFLLFLDATENRRFGARHTFAGQATPWPVQIESPGAPAMAIASDAKNLTILALDVTLRAEIPLYDAPAAGQPNDGKGVPGTDDPAGYPLVQTIGIDSAAGDGAGRSAPVRSYEVSTDQQEADEP